MAALLREQRKDFSEEVENCADHFGLATLALRAKQQLWRGSTTRREAIFRRLIMGGLWPQ